jgi:hypothetical protein
MTFCHLISAGKSHTSFSLLGKSPNFLLSGNAIFFSDDDGLMLVSNEMGVKILNVF